MALKKVKGTLERVLDKNLQDLVRGIRNHKDNEVGRDINRYQFDAWNQSLFTHEGRYYSKMINNNIQFGATFCFLPVIKVLIIKNVSCRSLMSVHIHFSKFLCLVISHYFVCLFLDIFLGIKNQILNSIKRYLVQVLYSPLTIWMNEYILDSTEI